MTVDLDSRYGVTVTIMEEGKSHYKVGGDIFERNLKGRVVHTVTGEGRTLSAAQNRALDQAQAWVRSH